MGNTFLRRSQVLDTLMQIAIRQSVNLSSCTLYIYIYIWHPALSVCHNYDSSSIRFENPVTIATRFQNGKFSNARIERISNRIAIVTDDSIRFELDSIMEKIEHVHSFLECSNRARIERISNRIAIVTGFSNRIESSSNRNCDRRFFRLTSLSFY